MHISYAFAKEFRENKENLARLPHSKWEKRLKSPGQR